MNNNKDQEFKVVIMAGGQGSRLWPLSRASHPKQFLSLQGQGTMLQRTVQRLSGLDVDSVVTICNEDHRFFVAEQLKQIDSLGPIILEPQGRNTAPAIAIAALLSDPSDLLLVLPADHAIKDESKFLHSIQTALEFAKEGKLVTFGIVPNKASSAYGYIKKGKKVGAGFEVDSFVEKPSTDKAEEYISSEDYLWNSGMFVFTAATYLSELKTFRPDIFQSCKKAMKNSESGSEFIRIDAEAFINCPSESIDYAVMEETSDSIVIPVDIGWNDLGSWSALWEVSEKDSNGNVIKGDTKTKRVTNSIIKSDNQLVAAIGVEDLVIVSTKDALLVSSKNETDEIKEIIEDLKDDSRQEWEFNREVHRPWGKYDSVDIGKQHQVKRITVNPGAKLSVQKHHHRSEHWIVVSGKAKVTNGEKTFILSQDESTYIPLGAIHSLENPADEKLEIIEVQTGSYLGEDDIVRYDDIYGRVEG
tara:strand:+ start:1169 stop:2587 length:1419 start_codon:yes stop_codon:yes gene_type:complete